MFTAPYLLFGALETTSKMLTYGSSGVAHKAWITWDHNKQEHKEGSVHGGALRGVTLFGPPCLSISASVSSLFISSGQAEMLDEVTHARSRPVQSDGMTRRRAVRGCRPPAQTC